MARAQILKETLDDLGISMPRTHLDQIVIGTACAIVLLTFTDFRYTIYP